MSGADELLGGESERGRQGARIAAESVRQQLRAGQQRARALLPNLQQRYTSSVLGNSEPEPSSSTCNNSGVTLQQEPEPSCADRPDYCTSNWTTSAVYIPRTVRTRGTPRGEADCCVTAP